MAVHGCYPFRVTRNSDLFVDEEEIDDLRRALEGELAHRRYGASVRLETSVDCPEDIADFLLEEFSLTRDDLYREAGPVNLNRLSVIYDLAGRSDLKYQPFTPALPELLASGVDLFEQLRTRDWLLHHPFQSFAPVMDFLRLAAADPQVLAIKQTLYRSGTDSPIVEALVTAANNGKDVTAIIELRARFDEEANIDLATRLQEAGVHVMYGVVGYKTHAKMLLVVRREHDGIRRYCHLGTGNYHHKTARAYTDYGLLTSNESIGLDVHEIFLQLTSLTRTPNLRRLLQSPFTLHERLLELIRGQAARGGQGRIIARMNALTEPQVIEALYAASRAGCQIDLIVRGMCALRAGVPGMSEHIRVRSIVGRFLEHPRVWCFGEGPEAALFCSSADWMERNLFRRVEIAFPILDPALHAQVREELGLYLADTADTWLQQPDGRYVQARDGVAEPVSAQCSLLQRYTGTASA
jgi:polyphosphate kinase